jgi:uncharacterized membrane protein
MKIKIAQVVSIFLLCLVTGVFWGTWFSLARSMTSITPATFLEVGSIMIRNLALPMAMLMPLTFLSMLAVLFLLYREKAIRAFYLALASLALFILALAITLLVNVPIDNQLKQWTVQTLPSDWEIIRGRWSAYHSIRTFVSLAALALMLAATLPSRLKHT